MLTPHVTAEKFLETRYELPQGGQWCELVAGQVVELLPPSELHGTIVLNFSKAVAEHLPNVETGTACFDLGLIVSRDADTVRFPAVSLFAELDHFALADEDATETAPQQVFEVASTSDRRETVPRRVSEYHQFGVETVWVADPAQELVTCYQRGESTELRGGASLDLSDALEGLRIAVSDLFAVPEWWT